MEIVFTVWIASVDKLEKTGRHRKRRYPGPLGLFVDGGRGNTRGESQHLKIR